MPGRGARASSTDDLADDLGPLVETLLETIPPPSYDPDHPLQALVTNLDASPYVGRPRAPPGPARDDP